MRENNIHSVQKLFYKICHIFKQVKLEVSVPLKSSETIQLLMPKELNEENSQIGSIQYGGIKYPITNKSLLNLSYVELRLKGDFLREIGEYDQINGLIRNRDANDWIKYKFVDSIDEIRLAHKIARYLTRGFERTYGNKYLTLGIDHSIYELPRQIYTSRSHR